MAVALDTNILWPLLDAEEPAVSILTPILDGYNATDGLVMCAPVYVELLAGPGAATVALDAFLDATRIIVDVALSRRVWQEAGFAFRAYAERRIAAGTTWPRRVLADFVIAAEWSRLNLNASATTNTPPRSSPPSVKSYAIPLPQSSKSFMLNRDVGRAAVEERMW